MEATPTRSDGTGRLHGGTAPKRPLPAQSAALSCHGEAADNSSGQDPPECSGSGSPHWVERKDHHSPHRLPACALGANTLGAYGMGKRGRVPIGAPGAVPGWVRTGKRSASGRIPSPCQESVAEVAGLKRRPFGFPLREQIPQVGPLLDLPSRSLPQRLNGLGQFASEGLPILRRSPRLAKRPCAIKPTLTRR